MDKCKYCNEPIRGKYVLCDTMPKIPITTIFFDRQLEPKDFMPKREKVCAACMEDMGVRITG